jgi:hypothetical protein
MKEEELLINTVAVLGILLDNLDELEQQKFYARTIKFHGKALMKETENVTKQIFNQVPEDSRPDAIASYMEYYKKNAELIKLVVNTTIEKKDSILKLIRENEISE